MVTKKKLKTGSEEHVQLLSIFEVNEWEDLMKEHEDIAVFMIENNFTLGQVKYRFDEWKRSKNKDNTNSNTGNDKNNSKKKTKKKKKNKKKITKKKKNENEEIEKGTFIIPEYFRSIDAAIDDLKSTEAYINLKEHHKEVEVLLFNEKEMWNDLQNSLLSKLKSIIEEQDDTTKASIICSRKFSKAKKVIIDDFKSKWDSFSIQGYPKFAVSAKAKVLAIQFCRKLQKALSEKCDTNDINNSINKTCNSDDIIPEDSIYQQRLYYISGWLLYAAQKRASRSKHGSSLHRLLPELINNSSIESSNKECKSLPTDLVETIQVKGGFTFANTKFYYFVAVIEKVCADIITSANLAFGGSSIFQRLYRCLTTNDDLKNKYLLPCFDDVDIIAVECDDVHRFLIKTYTRMRGKDFVRNFMGKYKHGPEVGLRQTMAVLSNKKNYNNDNMPKIGDNDINTNNEKTNNSNNSTNTDSEDKNAKSNNNNDNDTNNDNNAQDENQNDCDYDINTNNDRINLNGNDNNIMDESNNYPDTTTDNNNENFDMSMDNNNNTDNNKSVESNINKNNFSIDMSIISNNNNNNNMSLEPLDCSNIINNSNTMEKNNSKASDESSIDSFFEYSKELQFNLQKLLDRSAFEDDSKADEYYCSDLESLLEEEMQYNNNEI